ncbi:hypothetical protein GE061_011608 [Apolygus lucorum]|uniref:TFIIS N-terminal domain-containing protein n=1 Tax=Apolygus lucorum TaxID=248454 RepID=A0A8S9XY90_APOLU|nr:hypothetical protein GE061_011608 [Apolygus lucorum]
MTSKSIVDQIRHYQKDIERCPENSERMIRCIQRLYVLPILVQHLQETGVGRSVNSLRKFNGEVGEAAKALVTKWKAMVAAEESDDEDSAPVETDSKRNPPPNSHANENGSKLSKDTNNSSKHDSSKHSSSHKRSHSSTASEDKADRKSSSSSTDKTDRKSSSDKNDKHRHSHHVSKSKETVKVKEEKGSKTHVSSRDGDKSSSSVDRSRSERKDKDESTSHSPCRKKRKKNCVKVRRKEAEESDDDSSDRDDGAKDTESGSDRVLPELSDEDSDDQDDVVENNNSEQDSDDEDGDSEKNSSSGEDSDPKSRKKSSSREHHKSNSSSHESSSSKHKRSHKRDEKSDSKKSSSSSSKTSSKDLQKMIKENEKKIKREKFEKTNYDSGGSTPKGSSSPIKSKEKSSKVKVETNDDGSIDAGSGFSFADALAGLNPSPKKKKKAHKDDVLSPKPSSSSSSHHKSSSSSSHSQKKSSSSSSSLPSIKKEKHFDTAMPELLKRPIKLENLELDINSTLPEINPHYKPLPHVPEHSRRNSLKSATNEEEMFNMMMNKNQRTKVFSGGKSNLNTHVPSLYDLCIKLLYDNVESLEYTGGVPYDLLKPLLEKLNPDQLFVLEHFNAYLIEDTGTLWEFHAKKYFRNKVRQEGETWRDQYIRCMEEREEKLKALTQNITQSIAASTPVRKAKLAYVDSAVKPPRNVLRNQARYGTGVGDSSPTMKAHAAEKREILAKAVIGAHNPANIATTTVPAPPQSSAPRSWSAPAPSISKKRKAPLMAKALQLIKGTNRFKR